MSSVKRRKVDGDLPSGFLEKQKKTKRVAKESSPTSASESASPEPEPAETLTLELDAQVETDVTKTFKDLVSGHIPGRQLRRGKLINRRALLIRYATPVPRWGTKLLPQFKLSQYLPL